MEVTPYEAQLGRKPDRIWSRFISQNILKGTNAEPTVDTAELNLYKDQRKKRKSYKEEE